MAEKRAAAKQTATSKAVAKSTAGGRKAAVKKAAATKKAPARKAPASKSPAKKAPAKKVPASKAVAKSTARASTGFTAEERAAMRERARETKAAGRKANGESEVLAKIAEMSEPDRSMARRLHAVVMANGPDLAPRTWYGMPAYARDDAVLCFFQGKAKFNSRYATFGFNDKARLDDGDLWPTSFALRKLTPAAEKKIGALVKKAVR